jgi:hypothetical protein
MDKKVLYALTSKIFNTLKKLGIKPKIGVTTGVKRLPGSRNSFNTDLSKLEGGDPEGLKRLIANDADFLPQATADEIAQYNNNLEYLQSTFPEVFSKPQVVTEAKTGIKTLVDDVNPKSKKLTKDEIADYEEQIGRDAEEWLSEGTIDEAEKALKNSKAEEAYYRGQYLTGKLDPVAGEKTQGRMDFLRKKAEYAEDVKDRRLITVDEINELDELERVFEPRSSSSINISDPKTAESFTNFAKQNDPEGFKKIQKIVDDINNKNTLEDFDVKDREPNAKGGLISGIGTMFRKRGR